MPSRFWKDGALRIPSILRLRIPCEKPEDQ
jgi:hypothetical protein